MVNYDYVLYGLVVIAFLGIIVFWLWMESKFKFRVRVKQIVSGRRIIKNHRARFYEDKDKSAWWRLSGEQNKSWQLIPLPPEGAIEIDEKGKKYVECYRFESGEVVFIKDIGKVEEPPTFDVIPKDIQNKIDNEKDPQQKKEILDNWKKTEIEEWKKDNNIIAPYQPITSNQRMGYLSNIKKAEMRKTFDWKTKLIPIASIGAIVMVLVALMVFWGDIAAPALQAGEITKNNIAMQKEIVEVLKDIKLEQQTISDKINTINDKNLPPD